MRVNNTVISGKIYDVYGTRCPTGIRREFVLSVLPARSPGGPTINLLAKPAAVEHTITTGPCLYFALRYKT